jgi:O-antigen ligase
MSVDRAGVTRGPAPAAARLRWGRDDGWLAIAAPALIFFGHLLYGALLPQAALALTLMAAILFGASLLRRGLRHGLQRLDNLGLPAALFCAVVVVALWSLTPFVPGGPHPVWAYLKLWPGAATVDRSATLLETIKLFGLSCFFGLGLVTGGSDGRARLAIDATLALTALLGIWGLVTFAVGDQPGGGNRMEANFLSANTAGAVIAATLVLTIGPLLSRLSGPPSRGFVRATVYGVGALVFLACLFATASRGAFLAFLCGLLVIGAMMVFAGRLRWSRAALAMLTGFIGITLLLALSGEFLLSRILGGVSEFDNRAFLLSVHWQAFLDSPLFGYGLGTFDVVNRMLLNAATFPKIWAVRAAHNVYLTWLEQGGLLGALPMFACIAALIGVTLRTSLRRSRMLPTLFSLLAVDAVFLVHGAMDFALEMFSVAAMWAYLLGLQFALAQGSSAR